MRLTLFLLAVTTCWAACGPGLAQWLPGGDRRPGPPGRPDERDRQPEQPVIISEPIEQIRKALKAIFPLRIKTDQPNTYATTTAFFVSSDGLAVCPFHPLKAADSAQALLDHSSRPVPVELVDVEPRLDLALIRIPKEHLPVLTQRAWIPVPREPAQPDGEVWLLGRSANGDPTVTYGNCTRVIRHYAFRESTRRALPFDPLSRWVVMTCHVRLDQSGGPVINAKGQLVGMGVWFWRAGSGDPRRSSSSTENGLALASDHVRDMLEHMPDNPLTFAAAKLQYATATTAFHTLPRITMTSQVNWNDLRRIANDFHKASLCPLCQGKGYILLEPQESEKDQNTTTSSSTSRTTRPTTSTTSTYRPTTGTTQPSASATDDQEQQTKPCPRCQETGLANADAVVRLGANIVQALAQCDMRNPQAQRNLVLMHSEIQEVLKINPQRMSDPLNTEARKYFHMYALNVGQPVMFLGAVDSRQVFEDQPVRMITVSLGDALSRVILSEPDIADDNLDDVVLAGGILAGYLTSETGRPVPVLSRGFVIKIPPQEQDNSTRPGSSSGSSSSSSSSSSRSYQSAQDRYREWMRARWEAYRRMQSAGWFHRGPSHH